jgi:hypothetical protein
MYPQPADALPLTTKEHSFSTQLVCLVQIASTLVSCPTGQYSTVPYANHSTAATLAVSSTLMAVATLYNCGNMYAWL